MCSFKSGLKGILNIVFDQIILKVDIDLRLDHFGEAGHF